MNSVCHKRCACPPQQQQSQPFKFLCTLTHQETKRERKMQRATGWCVEVVAGDRHLASENINGAKPTHSWVSHLCGFQKKSRGNFLSKNHKCFLCICKTYKNHRFQSFHFWVRKLIPQKAKSFASNYPAKPGGAPHLMPISQSRIYSSHNF